MVATEGSAVLFVITMRRVFYWLVHVNLSNIDYYYYYLVGLCLCCCEDDSCKSAGRQRHLL